VPLSLKIFLTALAIVDDIAAVLTIAVFYSSNIEWMLIAYALIPFAVLVFLLYRQIYSKYITIIFGIIIWVLFLKSGIHPTIAGILVAFTIPLSQKIGLKNTIDQLEGIVEDLDNPQEKQLPLLSKEQGYSVDDLQHLTTKVQSPLLHIEDCHHGWVAYIIILIFAFFNAGVSFRSDVS